MKMYYGYEYSRIAILMFAKFCENEYSNIFDYTLQSKVYKNNDFR